MQFNAQMTFDFINRTASWKNCGTAKLFAFSIPPDDLY